MWKSLHANPRSKEVPSPNSEWQLRKTDHRLRAFAPYSGGSGGGETLHCQGGGRQEENEQE